MSDRLSTAEDQQLRFLLRELTELKELMEMIKQAKENNSQDIVAKIELIFKTLQGGFFDGEQRIEYKLARTYKRLKELINKHSGQFTPQENRTIRSILEKTEIYNTTLEILGSRGGQIEKALRKTQQKASSDNFDLVKGLITQAITADNAFQVELAHLRTETNKIKILKSKAIVLDEFDNLAVFFDRYRRVLILYNHQQCEQQAQEYHQLLDTIYDQQTPAEIRKKSLQEYQKYCNQIKSKVYDSTDLRSFPRKLDYMENKFVEMVIIGYCEFKLINEKVHYAGAFEIWRIAAKKGFGPFLFELVFALAATYHRPVVIDRQEVSAPAQKVWGYFDTNRTDIIKYPASFSKYPQLVGYTPEEVIELFGSGPIGSTFDSNGYPIGIPREKLNYLLKNFGKSYSGCSYLEHQTSGNDNKVVGGRASLDKAYYCEREINTLLQLMEKKSNYQETLIIAGGVFFQNSRSLP